MIVNTQIQQIKIVKHTSSDSSYLVLCWPVRVFFFVSACIVWSNHVTCVQAYCVLLILNMLLVTFHNTFYDIPSDLVQVALEITKYKCFTFFLVNGVQKLYRKQSQKILYRVYSQDCFSPYFHSKSQIIHHLSPIIEYHFF